MVTYQEIVQMADGLSPSEKLGLAKALLGQVYPMENVDSGIVKTEGICGGSARIVNSRIPVRSIVEAKQQNYSDAKLLEFHPTIGKKDIENALLYYAKNRDEIEEELQEEAEL